MDKCKMIKSLLPLYILGELDEKEKRKVDTHLLSCKKCKNELEIEKSILNPINFVEKNVDFVKEKVTINEMIDKKLRKTVEKFKVLKLSFGILLSIIGIIVMLSIFTNSNKNNYNIKKGTEVEATLISSIDLYKNLDLYENLDFFENMDI